MKKLASLVISLSIGLLCQPVFAQTAIDKITVSAGPTPQSRTFSVSLKAPSNHPGCGVKLLFGDGQHALGELTPGKPATFTHTYKTRGNFAVVAIGAPLRQFFGTLDECPTPQPVVTWALDPGAIEDGSLDILILGRTRPGHSRDDNLFGTNIDGSVRLNEPKAPLCVGTLLQDVKPHRRTELDMRQMIEQSGQFGLLAIGELYRLAGADNVADGARSHALEVLGRMGYMGGQWGRCTVLSNQGLDHQAEVLAVPRGLMPSLAALARVMPYPNLDQYAVLSTLPFKQAQHAGKLAREKAEQTDAARRATADELARRAAAGDRSKLGALVLHPSRLSDRTPGVCAVDYPHEDQAAVLGYRELGADMLPADLKSQLRPENSNLEVQGRSAFEKTFPNINDAYLALTKAPLTCTIFIDFPANLVALEQGLQRERRFTTQPGMLMPADAMRERFAQRRGFASFGELQFARTIGADLPTLKILNAEDITTREALDRTFDQMAREHYATERNLTVLLAYLRDRADGKARNLSAVGQRDQRETRAREYPFEATLSCGFQGRHLSIAACFAGSSGGTSTELEVRNGDSYALYRPWELARAGTEERDVGLVIPLKPNFEIKAQNNSEQLTLTLTLRETLSGKEVFVKSAAQYGVVATRR